MPRTRRYIFNTLACLVLLLLLLLFGVGFYLVLVALYPGAVVVLYWGKWRKRRQLAMLGKCPTCTYDLTGNQTGVCPECGAAATANKSN